MEVAITKISSKGQIVIPLEMRDDIKEGDKILIFKEGKRIMMEKVADLDKKLANDLVSQFEKSLEDLKKGRVRRMDKLLSKSKFTQKDADELSKKVNAAANKRFKDLL